MQIAPKSGPDTLNPAKPGGFNQTQTDNDRKARAMAALMGSAPAGGQQTPVLNPTSIDPVEHAQLQAAAKTQESPIPTQQTPTIEAPAPVETKAVEPEESPLSQHYAILARKEKALRAKVAAQETAIRQKEAAIKAQEDALKARELEYQSKYIPKERFAEDPLSVLNDSGVSYEKLTELMLNPQSQQVNAEMRRYQAQMDAKLKAIEDANAKATKAQQDAQSQQYQQALKQIHFDVKAEVANNPDFELIRDTGSSQDVVTLIERVFKKDGYVMSIDEACKLVEEDLLSEAEKIFKIKKLQNRFQQAASAPAPAAKPSQPQQQPSQMKTLTNAVTSTKKLSARDRAVLAMQGKLK